MILQKEIRDKAREWQVPADTVDKDYVLGQFVSNISRHYHDELVFKGGTCLRKCYFPWYRFSEDLDFSAKSHQFELEKRGIDKVIDEIFDKTGLQFYAEPIKPLVHKDELMGYQVSLKYWGANHSRNQRPLPPERWFTRIKLEISTEELLVLPPAKRKILHPYSDRLCGDAEIDCYPLHEIIAEKLRALKQRAYTAPRDFYDLYHLTNTCEEEEWKAIKEIFMAKMKHKRLSFSKAGDFIAELYLKQVEKAWSRSLAHQIMAEETPPAAEIISEVISRIRKHL
jgi:predicted nucleotidyltransferase component of viral defense system